MRAGVSRGDTIVEMVLAFAIFSLAAIGTMVVINNGVAITQRNLETTLVREQIDSQAELLRYVHDTKNPAWTSLISSLVATPEPLSQSCQSTGSLVSKNAFYVQPTINANPALSTIAKAPITGMVNYSDSPDTYAKIDYERGAVKSEGLWIQATKAQQNGPVVAYDFYIHACWNSVGSHVPMTLGTIVRIYD